MTELFDRSNIHRNNPPIVKEVGKVVSKVPWIHVSEAHIEAIQYIKDRQSGKIKSLKTPWESFNNIGLDGIDWKTVYVIGARPGVGKTMVAQIIARECLLLNPDQDFSVLNFQFEMLGRKSAVREFTSHTGKDTKLIQSASKDGKLTTAILHDIEQYAYNQRHRKEFIVEKPLTPKGFRKVCIDFYEAQGRKPVLITLDHTMLLKKEPGVKDTLTNLQEFGDILTELKRDYEMTFFILSQLNREIEDNERQSKPGISGNYPKTSDIFGSDAMLQHADVLIAINKPSKYNLAFYGPEKFIYEDNWLFFHVLKARDGEEQVSVFDADYARMKLTSIDSETITKHGAKTTFSSKSS